MNKIRKTYSAVVSTAAVVAAAVAAFFFGVAAFLVAAFLVAAAFFAGAGLGGPLVIRPDFVLPITFSVSTTAGACSERVSNQNSDIDRRITYTRGGFALASGVCLGFRCGSFLCRSCFLWLSGFGRCLLWRTAFLGSSGLSSAILLEGVSQCILIQRGVASNVPWRRQVSSPRKQQALRFPSLPASQYRRGLTAS